MASLVPSLVVFAMLLLTPTELWAKKLKLMELENHLDFGISVGGSSHPCYRRCDGQPMQCEFNMTVSVFSTLSMHCGDCPRRRSDCLKQGCVAAGGTNRPIYVANLMLPGPGIHVCHGDTVTVRVENALPVEGVTLHWHGIWMRSRPHMDGVPYVSQCPIMPNNVFVYSFPAHPPGSHIWHAHSGCVDDRWTGSGFLEADGLFGPLVVRRPDASNPHAELYDEDLVEHTVALWHWYPSLSGDYLPLRLFRNESVSGAGILVNGKGRIAPVPFADQEYETPCEEFLVQRGRRYRFRFLFNSAVYCPVQVSIDGHKMLAIASDGADFSPVEVDSLMLNAGERWDVVLHADQPVDKYWIRMRALGDCGAAKTRVFQQALLVYSGSNADLPAAARPNYDTSQRDGKLLNPMQVVTANYSANEVIHVTDLRNLDESPHGDIAARPNHTLYVTLDFEEFAELTAPGPYPQNNGISFEYPAVPMLLQRFDKARSVCTQQDAHRHCLGRYCSCPYVERVKLGALVEMVIIDVNTNRDQDHPYHIHGTNFHVVAEDTLGSNVSLELVRALNEQGGMKKRLDTSAPLKDTVNVPGQGYAVIRFRANNPGFWFFHCHVSNHLHLGMAMVLQVGEEAEMPPVPNNFPRCGAWSYDGDVGAAGMLQSSTTVLVIVSSCTLLLQYPFH